MVTSAVLVGAGNVSRSVCGEQAETSIKDDTKKIVLKSLFIIPGKHVIDDILNSNDSWSEKLKSKGIEITIGKKSLLQYEKIREMYITKINNVIRNIK